ncbi:WYL domain-containing protein [Paenibacillus amylolyticus]|nr:WYL domain-containing protein [Paenibacillus amylolyticus]
MIEVKAIEPQDALVFHEQAQQQQGQPIPPEQPPTLVKARLSYRGMIEAEQDEHIGEKMIEIAPDLWELSFLCPPGEWDWAVRFFYRLGREAEVIEPLQLRSEIRQHAEEVSRRYLASAKS